MNISKEWIDLKETRNYENQEPLEINRYNEDEKGALYFIHLHFMLFQTKNLLDLHA